MRALERIEPGTRVAGPENVSLPAGYRIEPVAVDLNYVTSVSWDPDGNLLIAEGGFPYGRQAPTERRVLRLGADGMLEPVISGFSQVINDITVYNGLLYVAHRGRISVVEDGRIRDVVTGLPSWGMHQNNAIVFDRGGRMFIGQGTASNAGVVGPLALQVMQLGGSPLDQHDIPGADIVLTGRNYDVAHPASGEVRVTGAFSPWGRPTAVGQRLAGALPGQAASGAIMSANWDGSDLRVYAWGLRNPFGLAVGPDGHLYVANNGANNLPPRGVMNDPDTFWRVEEGDWLGWPDYYAGRPATDPALQAPGTPPLEFLIANHDELLNGRANPVQPLLELGVAVSACKFDFCLHPEFGYANQAFVAEFGTMISTFAGAPADLPQGHRVVRADLERGAVSDFAVNRNGLPASLGGNSGGLERPVEAKFGPDGNLYIADLGVLEWLGPQQGYEAVAGTGIVWRVRHTAS